MIMPPHRCLTIAGSDPSGGAGIQGDLRTFAAYKVYGMAVITALTAQNTLGVQGVLEVEAAFVTEQLTSIYADIPPQAVKTGMLANAATVEQVAAFLSAHPSIPLVVDPVMVATSGSRLLHEDALEAYRQFLIPQAKLVTPNSHEAAILAGFAVTDLQSARRAAEKIFQDGARAVLVKGGDWPASPEEVIDVLYDGTHYEFRGNRIHNRNSHGTGCALSAAICCCLADGKSLRECVEQGIQFVRGALSNAYNTGSGAGSLNHFWYQRSDFFCKHSA